MREYVFFFVSGMWICTSGNFNGTLAEFLALNDLLVDDDAVFVRFRRHNVTINYRHYDALRITIKFHYYEQDPKN